MKNSILVGTGAMALEYAKVLIAQGRTFQVVGRGEESAKIFESKCGIKPILGGIDSFLENNPDQKENGFIIATGTEVLMPILRKVLQAGCLKVLIEKPAAISIDELLANEDFLKLYANKVYVAYNRRFYASVIEAQKMILEDCGLQTIHFEFSEWAHKIEPLQKAENVKENWFFANSTHVVDLAFYFAGRPVDWKSFSKGGAISWHKKTNFVGAGITDSGVLFSYLSNWESAGRWGIELLTKKRRIYLKPIEGLSIQNKGSILVEEYCFDDSIDKEYKPGVFVQVMEFFESNETKLQNIIEHIENSKYIYSQIIN